jgi:predicted S18 family serine protease
MKNEIIENASLHSDHKQWNAELSLWLDELKSFNKRLESLVKRFTDKKVLIQVEHFQNQFIIHSNEVQRLQQLINVHEINIAYQLKKGEDAIDRIYTKEHLEVKNRMETQAKIFGELKREFFQFLKDHS